MKKALVEKSIVVFMFILVLVVFSFAQKDSKKLNQLYIPASETHYLDPAFQDPFGKDISFIHYTNY